ncbi:MAG: CDP-glycerol glycerophosphotransferase family protein, partial [Bifidobacteriaceae bacterium]|nr:CDP-glycerol glycerophosphotransferase family protein [Bifidobacteriaceae bacterium]
SQSINFLSTGFKIKIPKNAKELILKLSAGGFEREKKIELQGVIDYLLKKSRGETELEKFTDEWANDAFATDELGTANREKLIRKHLSKGFGPVKKNTVVFRTYYGEKCVDSALAMHEDLVSRAKGKFKLYWGVKNEHVLVPKGGIGVIVGSKEWFKVLSTSEYIVDNVHQNDYFYKQKGQKILQTFHGYPFKQMGYADWKQKGLSQLRVESFQRRADEWDWVLAPAPYTEPLYKKAFKYNGKFIDKGYPRNDILFDEEKCQKINKDVRKKLGILSDKKVVLYAPTFRDYLSTDEFHSKMVSSISNYQKFTEALGSDCVLLIRGHMMNARSDASFEESEQVKDVTNWDDINDLIIASDLAILDYSSLRFDWAQTHKPMIFFVPDLEKYKAERQFLISYENTAPGPKITTEDDLIQSVKNVDKWSLKYKAAYQKFLKEYTPNEDGKAARRVNKIVFGV